MQETVTGSRSGHLAGSARLELTDGVALLHPEDAVMNAMLDGWSKQQRARRLSADTAGDRCRIVRRFAEFAGEYPWNWTAAHVDEWSTAWLFPGGRAGQPISAARLQARLTRLGVPARAGRAAALMDLAAQLPAVVLSKLLGISLGAATGWNQAAGNTRASYAAAVARRQHQP